MKLVYEAVFPDARGDDYFRCGHAHETIPEAVACTHGVKEWSWLVAIDGKRPRHLTPKEEALAAESRTP